MGDIPFIVFSAFAVVFNIAPLCWQVEHNNSGPVCLGIWVIIANLNLLVNAIVWRKDAINRAPVWCDISSKIQLAAPLGILASDICILLLLARVVAPGAKMVSPKARSRRALYDYLFCFGFPIFVMATHILYQPFRFGIAKTIGCQTPVTNTWPAWVCYLIWAPLLSFVGCLLAFYVGFRLVKHRRDFKRLVNDSSSSLTTSRFVRLGLLSTAFFLFNLPLSIYSLYSTLQALGPYVKYDLALLRYQIQWLYYVSYNPWKDHATFGEWTNAIAGILVLVFFGFGNEALSYYTRPVALLRRRLPFIDDYRRRAKPSESAAGRDVTHVAFQAPSSYSASATLGLEDHKLSDTGVAYNGPFHQVEMLPSTPFKNSMQVHLSQESKVV